MCERAWETVKGDVNTGERVRMTWGRMGCHDAGRREERRGEALASADNDDKMAQI